MIAICSHTDPLSQLREGHWFTVHMWGSKSLYGKLCDLRRGFPLHAMWKTPPPHSPQLYAIFDFHCLSERVTSWHQIAKCLLYISSESQGESCLRCQREGFLGKQFIYSGFLDFSKQRKQGLPPVSVCDCELGRGDWFVVIWTRAFRHIVIWLSHTVRKGRMWAHHQYYC